MLKGKFLNNLIYPIRIVYRWGILTKKELFQKFLLEYQQELKIPFIFVYKFFISPRLDKPENSINRIRNRRTTFDYILQDLHNKNNLVIVETGCMRADHGNLAFGDDGCSTLIFDLLARSTGGQNYSVDISIKNINHAKKYCKNTIFSNSDSINFLKDFDLKNTIDLLYLDSFDFDPSNPIPSQKHHLAEIQAVYDDLKEGCLILIDDADMQTDGTKIGKANLV